MWNFKTCYMHQGSKIREYLDAGFEPFAAVALNKLQNDRQVIQLFFRQGAQTFVLPEMQLDLNSFAGAFLESLSKMMDEKIEAAMDLFTAPVSVEQKQKDADVRQEVRAATLEREAQAEAQVQLDEQRQGQRTDLPIGREEDVLVVKREPPPFSEAELAASRQVTMTDGFPAEQEEEHDPNDPRFQDVGSDHGQTEAQQNAIREIKKKEKVNITVSPVYDDGTVRVIARSKTYTIQVDGAYSYSSPTQP